MTNNIFFNKKLGENKMPKVILETHLREQIQDLTNAQTKEEIEIVAEFLAHLTHNTFSDYKEWSGSNVIDPEIMIALTYPIVVDFINNKEIQPEQLMKEVFYFTYKKLGKIKKVSDKLSIVDKKDPYFIKNIDKYIDLINGATIAVQYCQVKSNLTKKEDKDWDNRIMNFGKAVASAEIIRFDMDVNTKEMLANIKKGGVKITDVLKDW